jgi:hypothetical protein
MTRGLDAYVLCSGEPVELCPKTGRVYERGSGALSREEQSRNFIRDAAIAADMPKPDERCLQTGRPYEVGVGARPKSFQTANFLAELPAEAKAERQANFEKLKAMPVKGEA